MSSQLPPLDLTNQPVGFQGLISFNQFLKFNPAMQSQAANLWLFNESGAGLNVVFQQSGNAHYLPAGAWGYYALAPNDGQVQVTITYLLPNPPVSQLNAVYYAPGEPLPQSFTLGNSPIGIGGTVNTSSVQTLSNEGSPPTPILIIDIGNTGLQQLLTIYNDGSFSWSIDVGGVAHTLLKGSIANLLQIGMAGDVTHVLGQLSIAQLLTAAAGLSVTGGIATDTLTATGNIATGAGAGYLLGASTVLNESGTGNTVVAAPTGKTEVDLNDGAGNQMMVVNENQSAAAPVNAGSAATISKMFFNIGGIKDINGSPATTCGSGTTISHGLSGTPNAVAFMMNIAQPGSGTNGVGSIGATSFKGTVGAGSSCTWLAYR